VSLKDIQVIPVVKRILFGRFHCFLDFFFRFAGFFFGLTESRPSIAFSNERGMTLPHAVLLRSDTFGFFMPTQVHYEGVRPVGLDFANIVPCDWSGGPI